MMKAGILRIDGEEVVEFSWTGGGGDKICNGPQSPMYPDILVIAAPSSAAIVGLVVIFLWLIKEMILLLSSLMRFFVT